VRVEIDPNTRGCQGFRQVRTSRRIITIRLVFWCIMIYSFSVCLPCLLYPNGGSVTREIRVSYGKDPDLDSISTCLIYNIYLL
jgi:hypothetical protein